MTPANKAYSYALACAVVGFLMAKTGHPIMALVLAIWSVLGALEYHSLKEQEDE